MTATVVVQNLSLLADLQAELRGMGHAAAPILARALNRAGTAGKTAMVRAIRADTGLTSKAIEREIKVDKANRTRLVVTFQIGAERIPLIAFSARGPEPSRGRGRGVSYRLPTGRGRIPNAFIATMRTGHRGVYTRTTTSRLPIVEKRGPSVAHVFLKFQDVFRAAAQDAIVKTIEHEIQFANRPKGEFPLAAGA